MVSLPISHINPLTLNRETLVDVDSVSIKSAHNGLSYAVEWTYNGTILILDAVELPTSKLNAPAELNSDLEIDVPEPEFTMQRKRRFIEKVTKNHYNQYLQKVIRVDEFSSKNAIATNWDDMSSMAKDDEDSWDVNDETLADLPANRTIHFNCSGNEQEYCLQGRFSTANFNAHDSPILITLNFTIDLKNVAKIMTDKKDFLVIRTSVDVTRAFDENM